MEPTVILYKRIDNEMFFWQILEESNKSISIFKGKVGEIGEMQVFKSGLFKNFRKKVSRETINLNSIGYRELEETDYVILCVEYSLQNYKGNLEEDYGMIKNIVDIELGNRGLGFIISAEFDIYEDSIVEVRCKVVNFELAKNTIQKKLAATKFSNFERIYDMEF